jgi:autophagy-related protein 9
MHLGLDFVDLMPAYFLQVHQEFGQLFAMKIMIFVHELVSVILTPFVLWFSLPQCAPAIIDFFHDFTVHIPGRGYVCSFAEFDFVRHGNVKVSLFAVLRSIMD